MKKNMILLLGMLAMGTMVINAQGGFPRRTVEERVQLAHQKIDSAFKLEASKLVQVDTIFAHYYRGTDKIREELRSSGERPDMQVMRERIQPLTDARDKELKVLLGDDQFKKWKDEIEPALMPRRGPGGGANRQ
jgi:hypothetical protein